MNYADTTYKIAVLGTVALTALGALVGLVNHANLETIASNAKFGAELGLVGVIFPSAYLSRIIKNNNGVKTN